MEKAIRSHNELFPEMPDFESWTNAELEKYINVLTEEEHRNGGIFSFAQAEGIYNYYLEKNIISREDFDLFLSIERDFWNGKK